MMTSDERDAALKSMRDVSHRFYSDAVHIGVHPFIEFAGIMNEYIKACEQAHEAGVDFSECNTHSGVDLPLKPFMIDYVNEKLECIFIGRSVISTH